MKNLKFGAFCLGLLLVVGTLVTAVSAQTQDRGANRERRPRVDVFSLRTGGSELGVRVSDPSTRQSPQADSGSLRAGIVVDEVIPDSPAEKAGIKAGDVIVEYDGERVRSARQFARLVEETAEGRSVSIALLRDGKRQTVNATPENRRTAWNFGPDAERALRDAERGMRNFRFEIPREYFDFRYDDRDRDERGPRRFEYRLPDRVFPAPGSRFPSVRGRLGVTVQSMTRDLEEYFGVMNGGALVSSVAPDSAAAKAGIKAGDVIVSVNGRNVNDADDLIDTIDDVSGETTIVVMRDKKEVTLKAMIDRRG